MAEIRSGGESRLVADAAIVVDGDAGEIIERLTEAGWILHEQVDRIGGKRVRYVQPPPEQENPQ
jgi:hypothetical protein